MERLSSDKGHASPSLGVSPPMSEEHWSHHPRGQSAFFHPDSEGLQFSPDPNSRNINRDSEAPEPMLAPSAYTWGVGSNIQSPNPESEQYQKLSDFQPAVLDSPPPRRTRKWWYIAAATIAAVIIILAAVLGGVLGSRAHQATETQSSTSPDSTASSTPSAAAVPTGRVRSSTGTWNGTGITNIWNPQANTGDLFFQDAAGNINQITYHVNTTTWAVSVEPATLPGCDAANGTGLAGILTVHGDNGASFYLVYVNREGLLADFFQNSTDGGWRPGPGNLSSHRFMAPTDNRPALFMDGGFLDGKVVGNTGYRLYAGGLDSEIHQYSYDDATTTWASNSTQDFLGSWGYGGVTAIVSEDRGGGVYNRTVFVTNSSGGIQLWLQTNGNDPNNTNWPTGGRWNRPLFSDQITAPNSSLAVAQNFTGSVDALLFPNSTGRLADQPADVFSADFISTSTALPLPAFKAMPGSDFDWENPFGNVSLIWYQDEGTSIAWAIYSSSLRTALSSGHIKLQSNVWVSVVDK